MDAERERIERARAKNLAYIQQQDEREASQAADELLSSVLGPPKRSNPASRCSKGNSSVYITGLTTYMACRQLEGVCNKLGNVRRIKFYKDEKGGLKGDAVVTFSSRATMLKAVDRLNHLEVKPGVVITATEATFPNRKSAGKEESKENTVQLKQQTCRLHLTCRQLRRRLRQLMTRHIWTCRRARLS